MRPVKERQAEIKAMGTTELRRRFNAGGFGELRSFAEAELVERAEESADMRASRAEDKAEEALSIARCANRIAIIAIICSVFIAIAQTLKGWG